MNDPEKEVRETLDELFKKQDYLSDVAYVELVKSYIKSKAFADDPDSLVWGLTNFCGKLDLISESVFAVCERFPCFFKENEGKTDLRLSFRADEMFSVLLRLYENAQDEKNSQIANRCLDMWDLMLEKRVGRVAELTKAIEK